MKNLKESIRHTIREFLNEQQLLNIKKISDKVKNFKQCVNENVNSKIYVKNIGNEYADELFDMVDGFSTNGNPKIGLFNGEKLIGGVLLDEDYLPWEYRFDVVINKKNRGKGYLKLLINKLKENFNNDKQADQLSATVVNKKLTDILVNNFGFYKGEYEGDDFVWIKK